MYSCLILLTKDKNIVMNEYFKLLIDFKTFDSKVKNELENQFIDDNNISIFCSEKQGTGKSTNIQRNIFKNKKNYFYFPFVGLISRKKLMKRLRDSIV